MYNFFLNVGNIDYYVNNGQHQPQCGSEPIFGKCSHTFAYELLIHINRLAHTEKPCRTIVKCRYVHKK